MRSQFSPRLHGSGDELDVLLRAAAPSAPEPPVRLAEQILARARQLRRMPRPLAVALSTLAVAWLFALNGLNAALVPAHATYALLYRNLLFWAQLVGKYVPSVAPRAVVDVYAGYVMPSLVFLMFGSCLRYLCVNLARRHGRQWMKRFVFRRPLLTRR